MSPGWNRHFSGGVVGAIAKAGTVTLRVALGISEGTAFVGGLTSLGLDGLVALLSGPSKKCGCVKK